VGLLDFFANRERKAELRESKDEIMVGEIVRAMSRKGWPTVHFFSTDDFQRVKFKAITDPVLSSIYVTLNRVTGTGAVGSALFGSKATLFVTCEVRNYLADPDDLVSMYKTDLANLFKLSWKDVRVNHEYNAIHGTTKRVVEIGNYVDKPEGVQQLVQLLDHEIGRIREKLADYKKEGFEPKYG
jgi:hypothetical protein